MRTVITFRIDRHIGTCHSSNVNKLYSFRNIVQRKQNLVLYDFEQTPHFILSKEKYNKNSQLKMAGWLVSIRQTALTHHKKPSPYTNNLPHPVASYDPFRTIDRKLENQDYSTVGKLFAFAYRVVSEDSTFYLQL